MKILNARQITIIATLLALEVVVIMGVARVLGSHATKTAEAAEMKVAPKPIAPIAAGNSPHVVIDDAASVVVLSMSKDDLIHVKDDSSLSGVGVNRGYVPPLKVHTSGGNVSISRQSGTPDTFVFVGFGKSVRKLGISVPRGATVVVTHCAGAQLSDFTGKVEVHSQKGNITLTNVHGEIDAKTDSGTISGKGIAAEKVDLTSRDGAITLDAIAGNNISLATQNGSANVRSLRFSGRNPHLNVNAAAGQVSLDGVFPGDGSYRISTKNGDVDLSVEDGSDVSISMKSTNGSVSVDGQAKGSTETTRIGAGRASMEINAAYGSIRLTNKART